MPLILTRTVNGRLEESPSRLGEYSTLSECAHALAAALQAYPEYGSDSERQCWWSKDKLGRTYRFEVTREPPTGGSPILSR
jgi:hypothetical protein